MTDKPLPPLHQSLREKWGDLFELFEKRKHLGRLGTLDLGAIDLAPRPPSFETPTLADFAALNEALAARSVRQGLDHFSLDSESLSLFGGVMINDRSDEVAAQQLTVRSLLICLLWAAQELSEGQATKLLGCDQVVARMIYNGFMEQGHKVAAQVKRAQEYAKDATP